MEKEKLRKELLKFIPESQVKTAYMDLIAYASDASFYRLIPKAVVQPSGISHIQQLFQLCTLHRIPMTFRGGGTSLSGQSITDGILVDLSKFWRKAEAIREGEKVYVQPGITGAMVNAALKKYGRKIGPDPSSIASAMMGGILANNSSGMCCGVSQNSYHTLHSIQMVLPNGKIFDTSKSQDYQRLESECPELFNKINELKNRVREDDSLVNKIRSKYKIKNTVGYSLNAFVDYQHPLDIMAHLLIGSEGTLGFIADAVLNTVQDYKYKSTGLLYFPSIHAACSAITPLKNTGAEALELMDRAALRSIQEAEGIPLELKELPPEAAALLCEYQSSTIEGLQNAVKQAYNLFGNLQLLNEPVFTTDLKEQEFYWKLRKGMFPSVGAVRAQGTTVILEDVAFPLEFLADAVVDIQKLFSKHHYQNGIIFGHAKDGNIHFVVSQSFNSDLLIQQYDHFIKDVVDLVITRYNGTLKAEHGTGRNMAPFVETEWGSEAYQILKEIKKILDPANILNPGVIINEDPTAHLRNLKSMPVVEREVDKCIECGYCEHRCPSRDLTTTPRQRIVVRREMARAKASGDKESWEELWNDFQYKGLDTCAVDGLCATDCPVNINTGDLTKRLRKENHSALQNRLANAVSQNFNAAENIIKSLLFSGKFINKVFGSATMFKVTAALKSLVPQTPLWPQYLVGPVNIKSNNPSNKEFVYFPTCITRCMGDSKDKTNTVQDVMISLARKAKIPVFIPANTSGTCCSQAFSSKGYAQAASVMLEKTISLFWTWSDGGRLPIVLDVTSCTQTILNSKPYLSEEGLEKWKSLRIYDTVDFAEKVLIPKLEITKTKRKVILHPVCSLTKMKLQETFKNIARACAAEVEIPLHAGCCGMAGDRGFFFPELPDAATREEAIEVNMNEADGYYSSGKTCEIALSGRTEKTYQSILNLINDCSEEKTSKKQGTERD